MTPVEELARKAHARHHHRDPEGKDWDLLSPSEQLRWVRTTELVADTAAAEAWEAAGKAVIGQHRADAALIAAQAEIEALRGQLARQAPEEVLAS